MGLTVKFFITPVYPYGNDHYYHEIIALAEGFLEAGHTVTGNCNYWWQPETGQYLIQEAKPENHFDIGIYDYRYVTAFAHLLFRKGYPNFDRQRKHVLVDRNDWIKPIWWNKQDYAVFDRIFAGNLYSDQKYPANVRPWAIGLTKRITQTIDLYYSSEKVREPVTGYNFRVDHNMRGVLLASLKKELVTFPAAEKFTEPDPDDETEAFYHSATTHRHQKAYYKMLCHTQSFMTFGGYYEFRPRRYLPYSFTDKVLRKPFYWNYKRLKAAGKDFSNQVFIFQHDSFRFWEVLYSGAIALNLDLDAWRFLLPAMPQEGVHYLGIQTLRDTGIENRIAALNEQQISDMGQAARSWVYHHYSPLAQANRILSELNG